MDRKQFTRLDRWLAQTTRKPLIIRGARQVGKTALVRLFAERCRRPLTEINLERHRNLADVFARNDPTYILNVLEGLPRIEPIRSDSILFLDEIQSVPEAIAALRYFKEDMNRLPVLAAGSLLDFSLSDHNWSMPVGRITYLHMGSMSFTEFLNAVGAEGLARAIINFDIEQGLDPVIHELLIEHLRDYYFVGGMPEAVEAYRLTRQMRAVQEVHASIIDTYREDFPKYIGSRNLARIVNVFNSAAQNVGQKVKYVHYSRDDQAATIKSDIELLCMARVFSKVVHSSCNGLPLQADSDSRTYKLIYMDIGLMTAACGISWESIQSATELQLVNEGPMAEQFIGQHLQYLLAESPNRELSYWLREGQSSNAEVDYVVAIDGRVVPIEVKTGATGTLKSLHQFVAEKGIPLAVRFNASAASVHDIKTRVYVRGKQVPSQYCLLSLPLYLIEQLPAILSSLQR
ncbi:MAG: AAA family ATPase [Acidiferrobacterales bacterium]|nr:AAA family ATPase [Acidiferrobacterales bacterium]